MLRDARRFNDVEINRLVKFYEQAEREILDQLNRALLRANKTEYLAQMRKNIEAILQQLREGNKTWCNEAISRVYSQGLYSADAMLKDAGASVIAGIGAIHQQAAQILSENTFQRFEDVAQVIGRQTEGIYRDLALENVRGTVVGYDTWKQTANRLREQLAERGVTGFKDRSGRMWNMRTYTEMVARTTTMEAHLQGTANRLAEQGHDLVKVSSHHGACELCVPWQGKILSLTGKTEGYSTIDDARAAGLFHPRCRHAYGLHIDLDREIEELEQEFELSESKPEYYAEVSGLNEAGRNGLAVAFKKAIDFGVQNSRECLLTVDNKTGNEVYLMVEGGKDYVQFPPQLITFFDQAKANSIISVHNHPNNSSFSAEDLLLLSRFDSVKTVAVIGHDGTRYVMSIGNGQTPSTTEINRTFNTMVKKYYDHYNDLVQYGKMESRDAWKEHSHKAVSDLAKDFGWEYRRVITGE